MGITVNPSTIILEATCGETVSPSRCTHEWTLYREAINKAPVHIEDTKWITGNNECREYLLRSSHWFRYFKELNNMTKSFDKNIPSTYTLPYRFDSKVFDNKSMVLLKLF